MKSKIVGLKDLRENMDEYIEKASKGQSFLVVRKSKPVFKLSSPDEDDNQWEMVVDFTDIDPQGVPINEVLKAITGLQTK